MKNFDIILYHSQGCPYSQRVRDFMAQNKIIVPLKDIYRDHSYLDELVKIGGKKQVPCLVINGKALYESMDIIAWMKKNILTGLFFSKDKFI